MFIREHKARVREGIVADADGDLFYCAFRSQQCTCQCVIRGSSANALLDMLTVQGE